MFVFFVVGVIVGIAIGRLWGRRPRETATPPFLDATTLDDICDKRKRG
jgi:hypothetical protein